MAGGAFGAVLNQVFPGSFAQYGAYALVGMAALVAASTRGTLTAILMIFEMTRVYDIILPLLFACVIADMVASMGSPETIYTRKLLRRGVKIVHDLEPNVMELFTIKEVMVPLEDVITLSPDDALHKVVAVIRRTGHNGFPVIDGEGRLVGVVTHEDTRNAHNQGDLFVKAEDLMTRDMVVVTPYDTGETALRRMGDRRISHLPVVDPFDSGKLMGWVSKGDLVFAYEDYHRRMEAPITDEIVEAVMEGENIGPGPAGEALDQVLMPPSLMARLFGRGGRKAPADGVVVESQVEVVGTEVVVVEREVPVARTRVPTPKASPPRRTGPVDREGTVGEEAPPSRAVPPREAGTGREEAAARRARAEWEETPAEGTGPKQVVKAEWVEGPARKAKPRVDEVEKVEKRTL
jgi:CBS domain-containing protein